MEVGIAIAALVGAIIGFAVGRRRKEAPEAPDLRADLSGLVKELKSGNVSAKGGGGQVEAIRTALVGWTPEGAERDLAFGSALKRMHTFLEERIDGPLRQGQDGKQPLTSAVEQARIAVKDLEFFLTDPSGESRRENLAELVRAAARDFTDEWDTALRIGAAPEAVHVKANSSTLGDALYLVFHNAAKFGATSTVSVEIKGENGWGHVLVRDDGRGFSAEALSKAYDPFYSTSKGCLGLGLSHARRLVEGQGGKIHLRNAKGGGAEVEIALPLTR